MSEMISRQLTKEVTASTTTIFLLIGLNAYGFPCYLYNSGDNTITYAYQEADENVEASYANISGATGTLDSDDVLLTKVTSTKPYVRLRASAAGGSELEIGIVQFYLNLSNILPIINI